MLGFALGNKAKEIRGFNNGACSCIVAPSPGKGQASNQELSGTPHTLTLYCCQLALPHSSVLLVNFIDDALRFWVAKCTRLKAPFPNFPRFFRTRHARSLMMRLLHCFINSTFSGVSKSSFSLISFRFGETFLFLALFKFPL